MTGHILNAFFYKYENDTDDRRDGVVVRASAS